RMSCQKASTHRDSQNEGAPVVLDMTAPTQFRRGGRDSSSVDPDDPILWPWRDRRMRLDVVHERIDVAASGDPVRGFTEHREFVAAGQQEIADSHPELVG